MLLAFSLLLTSLNTGLAADSESFDERKKHILSELDERQQKMQDHKACVQGAADQEALKKCRESMREFHKEQKMERMERRKQRLEDRQKK